MLFILLVVWMKKVFLCFLFSYISWRIRFIKFMRSICTRGVGITLWGAECLGSQRSPSTRRHRGPRMSFRKKRKTIVSATKHLNQQLAYSKCQKNLSHLKGHILYPFSDAYFSSWTPVEQPSLIKKKPKKLYRSLEKVHVALCLQCPVKTLRFEVPAKALLFPPHIWKETKTRLLQGSLRGQAAHQHLVL